jgi:hypothetical protein
MPSPANTQASGAGSQSDVPQHSDANAPDGNQGSVGGQVSPVRVCVLGWLGAGASSRRACPRSGAACRGRARQPLPGCPHGTHPSASLLSAARSAAPADPVCVRSFPVPLLLAPGHAHSAPRGARSPQQCRLRARALQAQPRCRHAASRRSRRSQPPRLTVGGGVLRCWWRVCAETHTQDAPPSHIGRPPNLSTHAVECSHSAEHHQAPAANWRPAHAARLHRPSNSLISTAVQPASPRGGHLQQQPVSPKLDRANSVVSHTPGGGGGGGGGRHAGGAGRAGTPASMLYGAGGGGGGFLLPGRARHNSPARQLAGLQEVRAVVVVEGLSL